MRDDGERLLDMLEAIEHIERYAAKGRKAFYEDELIQTWIIHHFQIIGVAASKLSRDFRNAYRDIAWAQIVAMRHIITHEYFERCARAATFFR
jgi:uncharacterized protein with HEPN domain